MIRIMMLLPDDPTLGLATEVLSICEDLAASNPQRRLSIDEARSRLYPIIILAFHEGLADNIPKYVILGFIKTNGATGTLEQRRPRCFNGAADRNN